MDRDSDIKIPFPDDNLKGVKLSWVENPFGVINPFWNSWKEYLFHGLPIHYRR